MVKTHLAYVSVGSNLGDKLENCRRAIAELKAIAEIRITGQSRFYQTEPVDFTAQDWFVNAAARVETGLSPLELLDRLLDKKDQDKQENPDSEKPAPAEPASEHAI